MIDLFFHFLSFLTFSFFNSFSEKLSKYFVSITLYVINVTLLVATFIKKYGDFFLVGSPAAVLSSKGENNIALYFLLSSDQLF